MNGSALVFPGQGSQFAGMGKALHREFAIVRQVFEEASDATGLDLARLCFDDPESRLDLTEYTQPCVFTASLAAWRVLHRETGLKPLCAAGHSLGEYTALAAAGVVSISDAARAVHLRGRWMQEASPAGLGGMAAVMNTPRELIEETCKEAALDQVLVPANDNSSDQVVISGHSQAIDRALELLKKKGGRAKRLKVSGPFHSELMSPAAEKMSGLLAEIEFSEFAFPVIANVDAIPYTGPEAVAKNLVSQMTRPVRWRETVEEFARRGPGLFVETGPGKVLAGLIARTQPGAQVLPMNEPGHIDVIKKALAI